MYKRQVCYGMLIAIGIIFFLNVSKQRQNMMPMLWVIAGAIVAAICAIFGFSLRNWPIDVYKRQAPIAIDYQPFVCLRHIL